MPSKKYERYFKPVSRNGFSSSGTYRGQGRVGQTSLNRTGNSCCIGSRSEGKSSINTKGLLLSRVTNPTSVFNSRCDSKCSKPIVKYITPLTQSEYIKVKLPEKECLILWSKTNQRLVSPSICFTPASGVIISMNGPLTFTFDLTITNLASFTSDQNITWSISGDDSSSFNISSVGLLSFIGGTQFSSINYSIIVSATNQAGRSTSKNILITRTPFNVTDLNIVNNVFFSGSGAVAGTISNTTLGTVKTWLKYGTTGGVYTSLDNGLRDGSIKSWDFVPNSWFSGSTANDSDVGLFSWYSADLYTLPRVLYHQVNNPVVIGNGWQLGPPFQSGNYSLAGENPWRPVMDANNSFENGGLSGGNFHQSFTIENSGYISKIEWLVANPISGQGPQPCKLSLYEGGLDANGDITGQLLAEKSGLQTGSGLPPAQFPSGFTNNVYTGFNVLYDTNTVVEVTPGLKYTMELTLDPTVNYNVTFLPFSNGQGPPGDAYIGGIAGDLLPFPQFGANADYIFRTYVLVKLS